MNSRPQFSDAATTVEPDLQKQVALLSIIDLYAKVYPHHRLDYSQHVKELVRIFIQPGNSRAEPAHFGANANILHDRLEVEAKGLMRFPAAMDCMELKSGKVDNLPALRQQQLDKLVTLCGQVGIRLDNHNIYMSIYEMPAHTGP